MATRQPTPQPGKLVVRGYPEGTTESVIREWFEKFGPVEEVASPRSRSQDGKLLETSQGYSFVRFSNPADVHNAIAEMNNKVIDGHKLTVFQSLYPKRDGREQARDSSEPFDSTFRERNYYSWDSYDHYGPERHGYDHYGFRPDHYHSKRRPLENEYNYDYDYREYQPVYDDYYSRRRDHREYYRSPRCSPRHCVRSHDDYYHQPQYPARYPPLAEHLGQPHRGYDRFHDEQYDLPARRPPSQGRYEGRSVFFDRHRSYSLDNSSNSDWRNVSNGAKCKDPTTRTKAFANTTKSEPFANTPSASTEDATHSKTTSYAHRQ